MTSPVWTTVLVALTTAGLAAIPHPRGTLASPSITGPTGVRGGPPDTLVVDSRASSVRWRASGLGGRATREGTLGAPTGMFVVRHQQLTSGSFTVNMRQLDDALQGADLFDVAHNPTAWFSATGMKRVGSDRWEVTGDLTMRGVTRPIAFQADVRWEELGHLIATSTFTIDRREWGIGAQGAGFVSAFSPWAIQLAVTLDARRKQPAVVTR